MTEQSFDYVVVGGGSAGCAVASRLSENPNLRVLLIEAGPRDGSPLLSIPGTCFRAAFDPRFGWGFMTEPQENLLGRRFAVVQAKVLGGGSSVNGMVYTRGMAPDFDGWEAQGCTGWSYRDVLPFFKRSEASDRGEGAYRGGAGPVGVARGRSDLPIVACVSEALQQCGYPLLDDLNGPEPDGFGYFDWTIRRGRRASASSSYRGIRSGRANLDVLSGVAVTRVLIERGRARGVEIALPGAAPRTVRVKQEIVLCAGAINTAKLMLLSGLGPADDLRRLGIPVAADLPGVGCNLQNHMSYRMELAVNRPITAYSYLSPLAGLREIGRYAFFRSGFFGYGSSPFGGFFRSNPEVLHPDMQLFLAPLLIGNRMSPIGPLPHAHGFMLILNQGRPASRGSVTLRSGDPADAPVIDPRYFAEERDLEALIDGTMRMREVTAAPALAKVISAELYPGPDVNTRAALAAAIRKGADNHYHVAGTCRMGTDEDAVTDPQLRVRGVDGLRIADMSVVPTLVNGNTNAVALMIGERAAAFIRDGAAAASPAQQLATNLPA